MRLPSYRLLLGSLSLFLLAACADQVVTAAAPSQGSAALAVDLGGSSRISRISGKAGEGEGYDTMPVVPAAHGSMAGMAHETAAPMAKAPVPATNHSAMDQSQMDHSKMGQGTASGPVQAPSAAPQVAQTAQVQGTGMLNAVDAAGHKVTLNHNAIPAIGWPAMTMDFSVAQSVDLRSLKPGTHVNFTMQRGGDGMYVIQSIAPAGGH
ncbi:MAG: copper-binding protein [Rhodospirillales bacterium]|nr:copper-binding protein [Rhodospirillales bacterium]